MPSSAVDHRVRRVRSAPVVVLVVILLTTVVGTDAARPAGAAPRPSVWAGGITGSTTVVHDPDIVKEGDTWYVFSTAPRIGIRSSRDLVHWEYRGTAFPDGWPAWLGALFPGDDENMWAPDVEHFGGQWHLYYSRARFGTQDAAIGVATSPTLDPDDPDYGWIDHGMVVRSLEGSEGVTAIDPNVVIDEAGDPWLVWGSFWGGIALQRLDATTGELAAGSERRIIARRPHWYDGIEGAQVVRRNGAWWLFTSWGFCCGGVTSWYAFRVGRADQLTGPYLDQAGRPLTEGGGTLVMGSEGREIGRGHGSAFDTGAGWALVHHFYDASAGGVATLGFAPLVDLDGWPLGVADDFVASSDPSPLVAGTWTVTPAPENGDPKPLVAAPTVELGLRSDGTVAGGGSWRVQGGAVRIDAHAARASDGTVVQQRFSILVGADGRLAYGRDASTAALRAVRTAGPPGPDPVAPSTTSTAPGSPVPPSAAPAVPIVAPISLTG